MIHKDNSSHTALYMTYVENEKLFKHGPGEGQEIKFFTIDEAKNLLLAPGLHNHIHNYEHILRKHIAKKTYLTATEVGLSYK